MSRRRALALPATVLVMVLLLGGCWGRREPDRLAIVTTAAVDRTAADQLSWTVEISGTPEQISPSAGGPGEFNPVVVSAQGGSLLQAGRELNLFVHRELLWSHVNFILFGESAARGGVRPLIDRITRQYAFRRNTQLFVTQGPAGDVLRNLEPSFQATVRQSLRDLTRRPTPTLLPQVDLNTLARVLAQTGRDPFLPVLSVAGGAQPEPMARGMAVFRDDRMAAVLNEAETRGMIWLNGRPQFINVVFPCPGEPTGKSVGITSIRWATRAAVDAPEGRPRARVEITGEGDVNEWTCLQPLTLAAVRQANQAAIGAIRDQALAALQAIRRHRVDPVGFGSRLYRADARTWNRIRDTWRQRLAELPVDLTIEFAIRRTGLTESGP